MLHQKCIDRSSKEPDETVPTLRKIKVHAGMTNYFMSFQQHQWQSGHALDFVCHQFSMASQLASLSNSLHNSIIHELQNETLVHHRKTKNFNHSNPIRNTTLYLLFRSPSNGGTDARRIRGPTDEPRRWLHPSSASPALTGALAEPRRFFAIC